MLEKLVDTGRYDSQSEVLRAAIEQHYESLNDDGQDQFERVVTEFSQISSKLDEIEQKIEGHNNSGANSNPSHQQPPLSGGNRSVVDTAGVLEQGEESASSELEDDAYSALTTETAKDVPSIAAEVDESELAVRGALESLVDRGWVTTTDQKDEAELAYRISE